MAQQNSSIRFQFFRCVLLVCLSLGSFLAGTSSVQADEIEKEAKLLAPLYSNEESIRQPANDDWPEDLGKDFVVTPPEREPASVKTKAKPHPKAANAKKNDGKNAANDQTKTARRSRLPAGVNDGFELRVLYNAITTMIWVVKRGEKFDLLFANSSNSRASRSLTNERFRELYQTALSFSASETNIAQCKNANMQLHVVGTGKPERTITMCVNSKSKQAEQLRNFAQSLAVTVQ
jgi:hypothetical protein